MNTALLLAVFPALVAGPSLAKTKHCADPATHRRIACPATVTTAAPAQPAAAPTSKLIMPAVMKPPKG